MGLVSRKLDYFAFEHKGAADQSAHPHSVISAFVIYSPERFFFCVDTLCPSQQFLVMSVCFLG